MKLFGSVLIIIASITISYYYEKQQREKILLLKSVLNFIDYIKDQISYFSRPIDEIYQKYKYQNESLYGLIHGEISFPFSKNILDELRDCFSGLGQGYKEEEIKKLEYVSKKVSEEALILEKELAQRVRVFRAISIFVGCSVVILLV